ncbi:MAG: pitrilysin family protein [Sphingomonadales bacterium]
MTARVTTLANGLRVASQAMPALETAAVGVFINVGSRHEAAAQAGIAHVVEHMVFKGTKRRSARAIAEQIEDAGGQLNAYTARESTCFHARILAQDMPLAIDLLADLVTDASFDEAELAREREVILQEIGQVHDTPDDYVFDELQAAAFADQPLGRSILGTPASVRALSQADLQAYRQRFYQAQDVVVAAAGKVDHDALLRLCETAFAGLGAARVPAPEPARYHGGARHQQRSLEQVHLAFGLPGFAYDDPDIYALQVYSMVLGGGMSSRLFQEVREDHGLAYSIFSDATAHKDCGLFSIYAGTGADEAAKAVALIGAAVQRMTEPVAEAELNRARAQLKAGLFMGLESPAALSEQLGRHLQIFGRVIGSDELVARIDAVDQAAVARVGRRLLQGPLSQAVIGAAGAFDQGIAARHFGH